MEVSLFTLIGSRSSQYSEAWQRHVLFIFYLCACRWGPPSLAAFVALPLGLLWFHEPRPDQQPEEIRSATGQLTGVRLGTAVRDFRFWLIWMSVALIAVSFGGAFINLVPILGDRGLDASAAANAVMMFGIGVLFGRIITGLLLDRFWAGFVAFPLLCLHEIKI